MKKKTIVITVFAVLLAGLFFGCAEKAVQEVVTTTTTTTTSTTSTSLVIVGNTYYVATNGNDSNPGTLSSPWKTIQYAADQMQPGDGVYIKGGTYNEGVRTQRNGTSSAYIIFSAYPGEIPTIEGTGITTQGNGFIITHSYIKLNGLHICSWESNAIWTEGAVYLEIHNCEVYSVPCGFGFSDGTHDFVLNNCVAHHFDLYGFDASPGEGTACYNGTFNDCIAHTGRDPLQNVDGIALSHQANQQNFQLNRCVVYNVYDGFDLGSNKVTASRCRAYNCWNSGFKIFGSEVTIVNSLSYNNTETNLELDHEPDEPPYDYSTDEVTVRNCTFMDAGTYNIWVEWGLYDYLRMYNCIVAGGDNIGLNFYDSNISNYQGDYNIFHNDNANALITTDTKDYTMSGFADWQNDSGQDAHSFTVASPEAIFVNAASPFDLHLKSGSPAIDKGTSTNAPSTDFDGNSRPVGAGYDIGAYERQ